MYQKILVPVSFEEGRNVEAALEVAQSLRCPGGQITCLHVIELLPSYVIEHVPVEQLSENREGVIARLDQLVDGIESAFALTVDGYPGRAITELAETNGYDCIIVASHQPAMSDVLLGSTAAKVVRHAKCAVHVIR